MTNSKAIELARKLRMLDSVDTAVRYSDLEAFYAAAEAAGEKKAIDRLTAGVEMPEAVIRVIQSATNYDGTWSCMASTPRYYERDFPLFNLTQLLEYGAAQRLAGAREEREAADAMVGHYAEILASKREVKHD